MTKEEEVQVLEALERLNERMEKLKQTMDNGFNRLDSHFDSINTKFDPIDTYTADMKECLGGGHNRYGKAK